MLLNSNFALQLDGTRASIQWRMETEKITVQKPLRQSACVFFVDVGCSTSGSIQSHGHWCRLHICHATRMSLNHFSLAEGNSGILIYKCQIRIIYNPLLALLLSYDVDWVAFLLQPIYLVCSTGRFFAFFASIGRLVVRHGALAFGRQISSAWLKRD